MEPQKVTTYEHDDIGELPSLDEQDNLSPMSEEEDQENELRLMEQFRADPAPNYPRLQYGETIEGTIMRVDRDGILVDIGAKSEGIVQLREMQSLTPEQREAFQIGDELLVFVIQAEGREGHAVLSIDRARQERSWRHLQRCHERGDPVEAPVINYNKGGLLVDLDGVRGFVPSSQVDGISRETDAQKQSDMSRMVGQILTLKVIEINRDRNRLILSERQAQQDVREEKKEALLSSLQEGHTCTGTISSLCDFGAFVDIGGADGLVHLSELSWGRINHPSDVLEVGQEVQVYILSIDSDRKRIALSIKRTQDEPWSTVGERYHLGQIVEGTITQLAPFGAFIGLEEGVEGLIHISEMSDGRIQHPREVVQEGDTVQARIIRIDPTRRRIGLSLHLTPKDEAGANPHSDDEESKG
jgi:small subunit ribosomal protein S1